MPIKVSVLTVTQYSRRNMLKLLIGHILAQTRLPDEWVIVEGSAAKPDARMNATIILEYARALPHMNIVYVPFKKRNFSNMLNAGNHRCTGDIIVQMEDDDYYPPTRIEHAVSELTNHPDTDIAGCSSVYMYDAANKQLLQSPFFGNGHACNHSLAYKRSYLNRHRYRSDGYSVEPSFLNNFRERMLQLDPIHTIVNIAHANNTVNKQPIFNQWKHLGLYHAVDIDTLDACANKYLTEIYPNTHRCEP